MKKKLLPCLVALLAACADGPEAPTSPMPLSSPTARTSPTAPTSDPSAGTLAAVEQVAALSNTQVTLTPTPEAPALALTEGGPAELAGIDGPQLIAMDVWAPRPDCDADYGISVIATGTETKVSWQAPDNIPVWSNENGWECQPGEVTHYRVQIVGAYPGSNVNNVDWSRWRLESFAGGTFCWPWTELDMDRDSPIPEVYDCGPRLPGNIDRARDVETGNWVSSTVYVRVRWIISGYRNIRGPWSAGVLVSP